MLLRRIAHPLLAAAFVANGVETLINPKPKTEATTPLLATAQEMLPTRQPVEPALIVQASAAVKVAAGLMMALGWAPRLAATVLAVELIPSTVAENPFWSGGGYPDDRRAQQQQFLRDASLLGGLLLAIAAGGKPAKKRGKKR